MGPFTRAIALLAVLALSPLAAAPAHADSTSEGSLERGLAAVQRARASGATALAARRMDALVHRPEVARRHELLPLLLYNLACLRALSGNVDGALDALEDAVRAGYSGAEGARADADLASLRALPRFTAAVEAMAASARAWDVSALAVPFRERLAPLEMAAGIALLWSEVRYNFVFLTGDSAAAWNVAFTTALASLPTVTSTEDYYRLLKRLVASLGDGHTVILLPGELIDRVYGAPPVLVERVGGRLLVAEASGAALDAGVQRGDEIVAIDGVPAETYATERVLPWVSASTPWHRDALLVRRYLLTGAAGSEVRLSLRGLQGAEHTVPLLRLPPNQPAVPALSFEMASPRVGYLAVNTFSDPTLEAQLDQRWPEIAAASSLVVDLRANNGGDGPTALRVLARFARSRFSGARAQWREYAGVDRAWGLGMVLSAPVGATFQPDRKHHFDGPAALVLGPETVSAAEDFAVGWVGMHRGPTVGHATAGTTGTSLQFPLPGGGAARVCVKKDQFPDGQQLIGRGVPVDFPVDADAAQFISRLDVVRARAVSILETDLN